jgi:hypothetical protein
MWWLGVLSKVLRLVAEASVSHDDEGCDGGAAMLVELLLFGILGGCALVLYRSSVGHGVGDHDINVSLGPFVEGGDVTEEFLWGVGWSFPHGCRVVVLFEGVLGWWCGKGLFKLGCVSCLRGNAPGKGVSDGFASFDEVSTSCACEGVMPIHVALCSALPSCGICALAGGVGPHDQGRRLVGFSVGLWEWL